MRSIILILSIFAVLTGCATLSHQDPKTGLEITYSGDAHGAAKLVEAVDDIDDQALELAGEALDKGMSTSVRVSKEGVSLSASYGYGGYTPGGSVGGYAPANTGYIPGQGFVVGPPVSTLPPLATSVVATGGVNQANVGGAIVPCPTNRSAQTVAEQAACALLTAKTALEQSSD